MSCADDANKKFFCRIPFTEVNIQPDGGVYPNCCPDWVEFPFGNLISQSWDEIWNGEKAQAFRRSMYDGNLELCNKNWCPYYLTAASGKFDRNVSSHENIETLPITPELKQNIKDRVTVMASGPENVGMHFDDSCNLACPTCRDDIIMAKGERYEDLLKIQSRLEQDVLTSPKIISLTGTGDPFVSPFMRQFLINFTKEKFPSIETIHFHTNAILWTKKLWEQMEGLKGLNISTDISIDAAREETYHIVRKPAKWNVLNENLKFIMTIPNVSCVGISMTVSRLNYSELLEFYEYGKELAKLNTDKFFFVEYKRIRRRPHHTDQQWSELGLEGLGKGNLKILYDQLQEIERLRREDAKPVIFSNMDYFDELENT